MGRVVTRYVLFFLSWKIGEKETPMTDIYVCVEARVFMENCVHSLVLTKTNAHFF